MRDLRYAIRVLLKAPAFTITATMTLALCIGANSAIFSIVDRVLLRPLPYPRPERLAMVVREYHSSKLSEVDVAQTGATWEALKGGRADKLDFAVRTGSFNAGVNFVAGDRAVYVRQQRVSAGYFRVLGVPPPLGREFDEAEDTPSGPAVAVLAHGLWMRLFNGDPSIVGRTVMLRGEPYTVVGIAAASLQPPAPVDVWTPARPSASGEGAGENYEIIARLRDGVDWAEADALVSSVTRQVVVDRYTRDKDSLRITIAPMQRMLAQQVRESLVILWAAVIAVLLIGCVNIAGLLLARAAVRMPEIATRMAIGGGQAAIVRQLLVESLVLAAAGGAAGIAFGYAGSRAFATLLEDAFGASGPASLDLRVLVITGGASLLTSLVFGVFPAFQATNVNLRSALIEAGASVAGPGNRWPRRVMVAAEMAIGVVLLIGAGLLIRTFGGLMALRPGFDGSNVMTATLSLQDARYRSADKVNALFDHTLERMHAIPGVQRAAIALTLPYERALNLGSTWLGAAPAARRIAIMNQTYVTPGYFEVLRIPVVRGRVFTDADTANAAKVIVVNEAFVKRYSPDVDPIGRQIGSSPANALTVIGVVGDIQQKVAWGNFGPIGATPASYIPAAQATAGYFTMVHTWFAPSWFVRTAGPTPGIARQMQDAVQAVDPLLPFAKFRTLDDTRDEALAAQRARATLLSALAGLALLLAGVGLYGLVANTVIERTRELGIRLALGASARQAIATAAAPGIAISAVGVVIGLAAARLAATTLRHLIWGVSESDPITFAAAAATVFVVAFVATLIPALRVARVDPLRALRQS